MNICVFFTTISCSILFIIVNVACPFWWYRKTPRHHFRIGSRNPIMLGQPPSSLKKCSLCSRKVLQVAICFRHLCENFCVHAA